MVLVEAVKEIVNTALSQVVKLIDGIKSEKKKIEMRQQFDQFRKKFRDATPDVLLPELAEIEKAVKSLS